MNLGNLISQFRTETADKVATYLWSDDELTLWANEAEEEAAIRRRLIREKADTSICQINVLKDITTYALNALVCEIVYVSMIYAGNPTMFPYRLSITTADVLDEQRPAWRSLRYRPTSIIHYDNMIEVDCIPDTDYTINLEVYRLPRNPMVTTADEPEINAMHHRHLVKWMKYRAYEKQDADTQDLTKAGIFLAQFEEKFGPAVDAQYRKNANADRPHHNRAWA